MKLNALILIGFIVMVSTVSVPPVFAASTSCGLKNIQIAAGSQTSNTQQVIITATPSCWSGSVGINRGNVDTNLISVSVKNGQGNGEITKIDTTQEVHPYADNPGMRGNNIIIPCSCSGTGLTKLSISATGNGITIDATPSTWAGTVEIVSSSGSTLASVSVPSSPGHVTLSTSKENGETIHAVYSSIISNSLTLP